jgi:asparagine synthase (glutamine-hydrolysing)
VYYDGAGEADERPFVREVLNRYPNIEPHYFTPGEDDIREAFSRMADIQDGPVPGSGVLSQYFLFKAASADNIKVMIDGQGADEFLAGYHNFYPYFFAYLLSKFRLKTYRAEANHYLNARNAGIGETFQLHLRSLKNVFISYERSKQMEVRYLRRMSLMREFPDPQFSMLPSEGIGHFDDVFLQHIQLMVLPGLLHFEDRNSMAFTIESRVPYLDHRLVEFAFSLPFEYKIRNGLTKAILRDSLRDFTPASILQRRDKKGFTTPGEVKWLRTSLLHTLDFQRLNGLEPVFNMTKVKQLRDDFLGGDNRNALMLWRLVALNEWMRQVPVDVND